MASFEQVCDKIENIYEASTGSVMEKAPAPTKCDVDMASALT